MNVKRRWKIAIAAAALIAIVASLELATRDPEPSYHGRTLSEWVSAYKPLYFSARRNEDLNSARTSEVGQALREMNPAALPTLVEWIGYEIPTSPPYFEYAVSRVFGYDSRLYAMITKKKARIWETVIAFDALGTNASPAIPQLTTMVINSKHPDSARPALEAMAAIGKPGMQAMVALLHNPNNPYREVTLDRLKLCASIDQKTVTDEVRQSLTDADPHMRSTARFVLYCLEHSSH